jgi:hypothetical protein
MTEAYTSLVQHLKELTAEEGKDSLGWNTVQTVNQHLKQLGKPTLRSENIRFEDHYGNDWQAWTTDPKGAGHGALVLTTEYSVSLFREHHRSKIFIAPYDVWAAFVTDAENPFPRRYHASYKNWA